MYSLDEVFSQSLEDNNSACLDAKGYQARISCGIKIVKDDHTKEVIILNTTLGGDFYKEITKEQYKLFTSEGWLKGLHTLALNNFKTKLDKVESKIKVEVNSNNNLKHIQRLKEARERILIRYNKVSNKLKSLINGNK
jgi:hypothetical protein|tara:strand:+ start:28 stop:441 length:414 start_codon:yes stop_codon:yes gene_type:complete